MHPILGPLAEEIESTRGVLASVVVFVNGLPVLFAAAKAKAVEAGATKEQLDGFVQLESALQTSKEEVLAKIQANPETGSTDPSSASRAKR